MKKHILSYINDGDIQEVTEYLAKGGNPNPELYHGASLLSHACSKENTEIVELLIKYGADVNHKSDSGNTVLHYLCKYNRFESAKILLKHGADLSIKGQYNETPYEIAQKMGHHKMVTIMDSYLHADEFETEIIGATEEGVGIA